MPNPATITNVAGPVMSARAISPRNSAQSQDFKPPIQATRRLNQLGDRRRVFQDRSWAALGIEQLQCRVDAQALVDGRVNVLRLERARVRAIALGVGQADDQQPPRMPPLSSTNKTSRRPSGRGRACPCCRELHRCRRRSWPAGVRLNSPQRTTSVESSRPRSDRSLKSAATSLSTIGRLVSIPDCRFQ